MPADTHRDLGHYKIVRELGNNDMGTLYLAIDKKLNRQVALKVPQNSDSASLARMQQEARAAAGLNHRGICTVFDFGSVGNTHYITMEYVEGTPLSRRLQGNKWLPVVEAVALIRKVAKALAYAHDKGVVHRDLKSANIMIRPSGEPVVMDFGLARRSDDEGGSRLTQDGEVLGTMTYMPPEQLSGDLRRIGPHSDVYSLCCVFYEALTGHIPFDGTPVEIILKINNEEPKPLGEFQPHLVGSPLDAVIQKAMAKRTSNRYQTMAEFEEALAAAGPKVAAATQHGDRRVDPNTLARLRPSETRASMPAHRPATSDSATQSAMPQAVGASPPDSSEPHVGCKIFAPPKVRRSTSVLIQAFAFPSEQSPTTTAATATMQDGSAEEQGAVFLPFNCKMQQTLSFHLIMQGGEVSEPVRTMDWVGDVDSVQFTLTVPARHPFGPLAGAVLVSSDDVPIGRIDFELTVVRWFRRAKRDPRPVARSAARFRKAYVSYSSKDRSEVMRRVQMLRPPITDIVVFQDVLNLVPGDENESLLLRRIDECDIFLLFWSSNARESEWVLREIRHATQRQETNGESSPTILPVLLEGPPPPPPPSELEHMHFDDYLLYFAK